MMSISREKIFYFFLFAFIFLIPLGGMVSARVLVLATFLSFLLLRNPNWRYELVNNAWDVILYFIILCGGLIYTDDMESGMAVLEKNLSFVVVPILFSQIKMMDKSLLHRICITFVSGVAAASAICLGYALWRDIYLDYSTGYYYEEFTTIIDAQPTYMAYYVCFSIIFLLYFISYEKTTRRQQFFIVFSIIFLSTILMLTAGRSTFVSMLMMSSFFLLKLLYEPHPIRRKIQGISVTILLLLILLFQSPYYQRIFPGLLTQRPFSLSMVRGDSWDRLKLWESALKASTSFFFGVGTGDYTTVMNYYYRNNGMSEYAESNFNAHNQFIQLLFSNGVIGIFGLLLVMLRPILLSSSRQYILGMLTFFPFFIYGISEVFLGRFQGIIFFVLLHQVFIKYLNQNVKTFSMKEVN